MANMLLTPTLWSDGNFDSPPKWWNGTDYDVTDSGTGVNTVLLSNLDGPGASAGDVVAFTFQNNVAITGQGTTSIKLVLNNSETLWTFDLTATGSDTFATDALAGGDMLVFSGTEGGGSMYGIDFTITPTAPTPPIVPPKRILELCYSKDGGHTFSPWRQADLGNQGDFNARALFRRLGMGRRIVLRIRYSGDSCRDVVQASVDTRPFP